MGFVLIVHVEFEHIYIWRLLFFYYAHLLHSSFEIEVVFHYYVSIASDKYGLV